MTDLPLVDVTVATYNHEKYIAQTLESVLMQKTAFRYRIIVGDDCSDDRTQAIIREYLQKYPDRMEAILLPEHLGIIHSNRVGAQILQRCDAKYIAILDGDDYWTDPLKLQKQVDFLNSHIDCAICFHNVLEIYEDSGREPREMCPADQKPISTIEDLLVANFIPSCSVMFQGGLLSEFPDWFFTLKMGDWILHIMNAQYGDIGYISEVMATYRIHRGGVWSGSTVANNLRAIIKMYGCVSVYLEHKYDEIILKAAMKTIDGIVGTFAREGLADGSIQAAINKVLDLFDNWPTYLPLSKSERNHILGLLYAGLMFTVYQDGDLAGVRHCWMRVLRYDRSWARNLGVWSIGAEAFLGRRVTESIRSTFRASTSKLRS